MQYLRVFVEDAADAVAAVLAYHRIVVALGQGLDGVSDVAQVHAGTYHFDARAHALVGDFHQTLDVLGRLAHEEHLAGVAVEAVLDDRDVDVDDVARLELFGPRNAVAHHVIDRGAHGLGETAVVQRRGDGLLLVDDEVVAEPVQLFGGHARLDVGADHFQDVGGQAARHTHFLDFFGVLDGDSHGVPLGVSGRAPGASTAGAWEVDRLLSKAVYGIKRSLFKQIHTYVRYSSAGCP